MLGKWHKKDSQSTKTVKVNRTTTQNAKRYEIISTNIEIILRNRDRADNNYEKKTSIKQTSQSDFVDKQMNADNAETGNEKCYQITRFHFLITRLVRIMLS